MPVRHTLLAAAFISIAALATSPASAQILRYANQGALKSLDPYTLRETTTIAQHGHVYEGLVGRDKELKIVPALAESWDTPEPTHWRGLVRPAYAPVWFGVGLGMEQLRGLLDRVEIASTDDQR